MIGNGVTPKIAQLMFLEKIRQTLI